MDTMREDTEAKAAEYATAVQEDGLREQLQRLEALQSEAKETLFRLGSVISPVLRPEQDAAALASPPMDARPAAELTALVMEAQTRQQGLIWGMRALMERVDI